MWSFCLAPFRGCQGDFKGIGSAQCYGLRERNIIGESGAIEVSKESSVILCDQRCLTYLALNPLPTPPFPLTETTASSKLHDEAASTMLAPTSSREGRNE